MKNLFTGIVVTTLTFATATSAYAAGTGAGQICNPTYGGGQNCNQVSLSVTKEVQSPNGAYVKNLSVGDARFAPGQQINFRVTVQNTGGSAISDVVVTDTFPQYLNYASGVAGTYDAASRSLTFRISNLGAGQSQQFTLVTYAYDSNNIPNDKSIVCVTNTVQARDNASGASAQDNSQACIEKNIPTVQKGGPITKTPATGPEALALPILGSTGILGAFLKRKFK